MRVVVGSDLVFPQTRLAIDYACHLVRRPRVSEARAHARDMDMHMRMRMRMHMRMHVEGTWGC